MRLRLISFREPNHHVASRILSRISNCDTSKKAGCQSDWEQDDPSKKVVGPTQIYSGCTRQKPTKTSMFGFRLLASHKNNQEDEISPPCVTQEQPRRWDFASLRHTRTTKKMRFCLLASHEKTQKMRLHSILQRPEITWFHQFWYWKLTVELNEQLCTAKYLSKNDNENSRGAILFRTNTININMVNRVTKMVL
jgi:hypothetical protein